MGNRDGPGELIIEPISGKKRTFSFDMKYFDKARDMLKQAAGGKLKQQMGKKLTALLIAPLLKRLARIYGDHKVSSSGSRGSGGKEIRRYRIGIFEEKNYEVEEDRLSKF